jgi:hypothetical protein
MLSKPGAEALLLWFLNQGYEVRPAGNSEVVLRTDGYSPVVQVGITKIGVPNGEAVIDAISKFFEERQIGYVFLILQETNNITRWKIAKGLPLPTPPSPHPTSGPAWLSC